MSLELHEHCSVAKVYHTYWNNNRTDAQKREVCSTLTRWLFIRRNPKQRYKTLHYTNIDKSSKTCGSQCTCNEYQVQLANESAEPADGGGWRQWMYVRQRLCYATFWMAVGFCMPSRDSSSERVLSWSAECCVVGAIIGIRNICNCHCSRCRITQYLKTNQFVSSYLKDKIINDNIKNN